MISTGFLFPLGALPIKQRITNIFLLEQQSLWLEALLILLCVCSYSQWYNLFFPLNLGSLTFSLSPPFLTSHHQITGCSRSLTPFHPTPPSVKECGRAALSRLHYVLLRRSNSENDAARSHKRTQTRSCRTGLRRSADYLPSNGDCQADKRDSTCMHTHIFARARVSAFTHVTYGGQSRTVC